MLITTAGGVGAAAGTPIGTAIVKPPAGPAVGAMTATLVQASTRAPFGEYVNRLSFDVASIDPALVTATGPSTLTITGAMTNSGPEALTNLAYRFQRGPALGSTANLRQELAEPSEPTDQVQDQFTPITPDLASGASSPFIFTTSITDSAGLAVRGPGVYPLMVNINGAVTLEGGPLEARIGELHLLLTVMGVPGSTPAPAIGAGTDNSLPVNVVWPLVDRPHLGVGGVFLDEDLLTAIGPGGRLTTLVNGLTDPASPVPDGTVTVVMDPQLLDELDRMSGDYRVVAVPGEPQPSMTEMLQAQGSFTATAPPTPPSAPPTPPGTATAATAVPGTAAPATAASTAAAPVTGSADIPGTVAGTGQVAAASFLGRLRDVATRYPVLALPYGDPDVVAMVRAGLTGEVAAAVQHGQSVADRVLNTGTVPIRMTSMAFPINGASDANTLAALQADGVDSALLAESSIDLDGSDSAAAQVTLPGNEGNTENSIVGVAVAQTDVLSGVDALIDQGREAGWAMRVNSLTGVLAQHSLDGTVTPAVFTPDRRWSPDAPGLRVLTDLLTTLGASTVIKGASLTDLAGSATTAGTADYPERAQAQELPADYLGRIASDRLDVASLRQTLQSTPQSTDPNLVLDPLDAALDAAASTAFRIDPAVGQANLATVESTSAGLRSGVEISSAGNSYTLASSTSPLVLTVQNNLPYDVPVRVQISGGERVGLTVSDPEIQVVPAGRSQQVKIPAEVTRSGQFQVDAQLVGADGVAWGPPVQLSVESTAYGALTVIIIIVAGGVLVLMVALRIVQRLRGKPDTTPGLPRPRGPGRADRAQRSDGPAGRHSAARQWTDTTDRASPDGPVVTAQDSAQVDDVAGMKTAGTGGVVRAGVVMAVATLVSRMTGFLSKVVLLSVLGVGVVNDAYTLSNTLPNIVFELLIGGVLTSVAIPLLSRARSDPDGGELYTQRLMTAAAVGLLIATALSVLAAPLLTKLYLAGDSLVDRRSGQLVGLPAAAADLLLRHRRAVRCDPEHQGEVRRSGVGARRQQPGRHRGRDRLLPDDRPGER